MNTIISIAFILFLVIDALGTLPIYLSQLESYGSKERITIALRELFFALILMCAFFYLGQLFITLLALSKTTVQLAGGIILLLIAIRLIFSHDEPHKKWDSGRPFIVPIATPLLASPSFFATITIFSQSDTPNAVVLIALLIAWLASSLVYLCGRPIYNLIGESGLMACQRLMGLLIALVAVQLALEGIKDLVKHGL